MMRDGELVVVAGQSRSGKSYLTAQAVALECRLLVWDTMGEFADKHRCHRIDLRQLHAIATNPVVGRFAVDVPVTPANFDRFCRLAWVWIRAWHARRQCVALVIEELADVTSPGKAPAAWGEIIRKSLRYGPHLYALTQRPAESDKTIMGNATVLRCHSMARADDRRYMARELDVDQASIDRLDFARCQWIARDKRTRALTSGGKGQKLRKVAQA